MQIDMHFYGVYGLARAAGINPQMASIIACSSQFVDDAIEDKTLVFGRQAVITSMTSHKPIDYQNSLSRDQWNVWSPFHFLPGFDPAAQSFEQAMVCSKRGRSAEEILKFALDGSDNPFGAHLAGIVAHVYADIFSHYGFIGLWSEWNKVHAESIKIHASPSILQYLEEKLDGFLSGLTGTVAELVPVGHGAVATLPDRPYLHWEYDYHDGRHVVRHNLEDYIAACEGLHKFFGKLVTKNSAFGSVSAGTDWQTVEPVLRKILAREEKLEDRVDAWTEAITSDQLFKTLAADRSVDYGDAVVSEWGARGICSTYRKTGSFDQCPGYLFHKAAWAYRNYVLDNLLPSFNVLA